ncbi:MAG: hypothetical protein WCT46_05590 [Candidatus Gracilibacteria bacterium]
MSPMRDQEWLQNLFDEMWERCFSDVPVKNKIFVKFSRISKTRLGSIRMARDKSSSTILMNGVFRDPLIPVQVVEAVLAHEIVHYVHGFCSPLKRQHRHPHRGGVVKNEMITRGLRHQYEVEKRWTKNSWRKMMMSL